jgi:Fic family protein
MNRDFESIDALKKEWDSLQPLNVENEARLWRKLRLEWNYNSNHIEGNTLTYGETELLLIHGQTTGDHQLRDYEEMKAHDLGIAHVRALAADRRIIGEGDIRDLNKIILKEPFWKEAITIDNQPTRKQIIPGEYKTTPNNVRTATGEIFAFASPQETPVRMQALVEWLRRELEKPSLHVVEVASKLHHDFVLIHPFDDGNGRVTRLLMNYVLLRAGYPPLIVKSADKSGYLTALRKADAGDIAAMTRYLLREAEWSLRLGVQAAKGESIEEPSDVEKEISLFIRDQQQHGDRVKQRCPAVLQELFELSWKYLFETFEAKLNQLTPLFADVKATSYPASRVGESWQTTMQRQLAESHADRFQLTITFNGYRGQAPSSFNTQAQFVIKFQDFEYQFSGTGTGIAKRLYTQPILSDESDVIATSALKAMFEEIKDKSGIE